MLNTKEKSNEKIIIESDMPISLANAIRRSVNYIPILAIDTLEISKNDSALYDEIIANRAGLVPLKNESLKMPEDCDCENKGCGKCSIKLKLSAIGPKIVYSDELSPKISVNKIPVAILNKDQELEFVAIAKMGFGVQHAKYSPGLMYYRYADDEMQKDLKEDNENFKKVLEHSKKENNKELIITLESWGQISAKEIFVKAIDALNDNIKEFVKAIK